MMSRFHTVVAAAARLSTDEAGTTAMEYAVIAAFLSIIIITPAMLIGHEILVNYYERIAAVLTP